MVLAVGAGVAAFAGTRPDPAAQAQADGCGRNGAGLFKKEQPTWVYVGDAGSPADGPAPAPQWVHGVVDAKPAWLSAHPTPIDDPVSHASFDFVVNVRADGPDAFLLGTGNFAGEAEETGRLHTEWEEAAFASFAWPATRDRVALLGNWVWDCGHWAGGGERTELHPLRAVFVQRHGLSPRSAAGETEADLLISTAKTPAGASADCAHRTKGDRAAFKTCLAAEPEWQDVSGTYRFDLVAPARPAPGARLRVRVVDAGSTPGAPAVKIAGGKAVVTVASPPGRRVVVAKRIFVGWTPPVVRPVHLRVTFDRILVRRAMDPGCPPTNTACASVETTLKGQITKPPGEWVLYGNVAGVWARWPLLRPVDGQTLPLRHTVDAYVAKGSLWSVVVAGRECDNGSLSAHSVVAPPSPCPRGTGEFLDLVGDDDPGVVADSFASPAAAVGTHSSDSRNGGSSCPPANARGCFRIVYRVAVVP